MTNPIRVQNEVPYRRLVTDDQIPIDDAHPLDVSVPGARGPFGDLITTNRRPIFAHQSTDELSILRDVVTTVNTGAVTSTLSEFRVNAPATGDSATLGSAVRGRYVPGFSAEAGIGVRLASRPAGASIQWGLQDDDDGLTWEIDDDGWFIEIVRSGASTTRIERADWNVDKLDGNGPSRINVANSPGGTAESFLAQGAITQVRFTWYGYGLVEWSIVDQRDTILDTVEPRQRTWVVHRARIGGDTSIEDPNLPIRITARDGADIYVGGRQYSVLGTPDVQERNVGTWRYQTSVPAASIGAGGDPLDSDWVPLLGLRYRSDAEWCRSIAVVTDDIEIVSDRKLVAQIFIGPTIDNGSWDPVPYTDGQSAVEVNRTGTTMTFPGGTFPNQTIGLDPLIVTSGTAAAEARNTTVTKRTRLPEGQELILAVFAPGANAATADSVLDWLEIR